MCLAALGSCYAVLDPVTRTMADLRHDFAFDPSYGYGLEDLLAVVAPPAPAGFSEFLAGTPREGARGRPGARSASLGVFTLWTAGLGSDLWLDRRLSDPRLAAGARAGSDPARLRRRARLRRHRAAGLRPALPERGLPGALLPRSVPQHTTADLDRPLLARAPRHPPARPLHPRRLRRGPLDGRQRAAAAPRRAPRTDRLHRHQLRRRDRGTGPALGAAHCPRPPQRADLRPPGSADLRPRCSRITERSRAPLLLTRSGVPRVGKLGAGSKGLRSYSSWRKHQRPARTA
jgi:hypothetical protein